MITDPQGLIWYKPREIAKLKLITSTKGPANELSNYNFILELIKAGKLQAVRYGNGRLKYLLVSKKAIDRYYQELTHVASH